MGYTLVVDPAVNPRDALHAHIELALTPVIDRAALLILGNEDFLLGMLRDGEGADAVQDYMAAVLQCGPRPRRQGDQRRRRGGLQGERPRLRLRRRGAVLRRHVARQSSWRCRRPSRRSACRTACTSTATISGSPAAPRPRSPPSTRRSGKPLHLAHLQFYGYGTEGKRGISSAALALAEKVNATPNVTVDVGQVMFGPTVTVSSDTLRQFGQKRFARPKKWTLWEGDGNGGGIFPIVYGEQRVHQPRCNGRSGWSCSC